MSLFSALSSATAGLRTVQANVKVVSDNISRADDPNRTRHQIDQTVDRSGTVVTTIYRRETDAALLSQVEDLTARNAGLQKRSDYLQKIGDLMRTTDGQAQLADLADKFQTAWKTLETSPESEVASYQLVRAADDFAREINRVSKGVEEIDTEMNTDMQESMTEVNRLLQQIDVINRDFVSLKTQGAAGNEVADKRDGLIRELNTYVGVRTVERPDGRVALFTSSGLALLDSEPAELSYAGGKINLVVGNTSTDVSNHFATGTLGALFEMRYDGSAQETPTTPSSVPTGELIRKLRSQLDAYANTFVATTKDGEPTSFADAYNNATPTEDGELSSKFFTGTNRFNLAVNSKLLDNTEKVKASAVADVVTAMNAVGRTLTADGLKATDTNYSGMAAAITGNMTTISSAIKANAENTKTSADLLTERYQTNTGVNVDQEIALLQQLQTSYAASARVMQVTNSMFDALEAVVK